MTRNDGFTAIEMFVAVAMLAALVSVALPKFGQFVEDARRAQFDGVRGSFAAGVSLAHAAWLVEGEPSGVFMEGTFVPMTSVGWPEIRTPASNGEKLYEALMSGEFPGAWTVGCIPPAQVCTYQGHGFEFTYDWARGLVQ